MIVASSNQLKSLISLPLPVVVEDDASAGDENTNNKKEQERVQEEIKLSWEVSVEMMGAVNNCVSFEESSENEEKSSSGVRGDFVKNGGLLPVLEGCELILKELKVTKTSRLSFFFFLFFFFCPFFLFFYFCFCSPKEKFTLKLFFNILSPSSRSPLDL